jgi:hypothetical protein
MATKFVKARNVTLPLLKVKEGSEYIITMLTAMALGKQMPAKKVTDPVTGEIKEVTEAPATVAQVKVLQDAPGAVDGEEYQMLCNTIFAKELREQYPSDSYVGKSFAFTVFKIDGKRYKGCSIAEVTLAEEAAVLATGETVATPEGDKGPTETAQAESVKSTGKKK